MASEGLTRRQSALEGGRVDIRWMLFWSRGLLKLPRGAVVKEANEETNCKKRETKKTKGQGRNRDAPRGGETADSGKMNAHLGRRASRRTEPWCFEVVKINA